MGREEPFGAGSPAVLGKDLPTELMCWATVWVHVVPRRRPAIEDTKKQLQDLSI